MGECVDGECVCRDSYQGFDCGDLTPLAWRNAFLSGFAGYYPLLFVVYASRPLNAPAPLAPPPSVRL